MSNNIRSQFQTRIDYPPSTVTGDLSVWLRRFVDVVNALPPISTFSYGNPNSNVTALIGTLGVNLNSAATSRAWVKAIGSGNTGWQSLATL